MRGSRPAYLAGAASQAPAGASCEWNIASFNQTTGRAQAVADLDYHPVTMPEPSDDKAKSLRLLSAWLLSMSLFFAVGWLIPAIFGGSGITWAFAITWTLLATGAAFKWHRTRSNSEPLHEPPSGDSGSAYGPQ